jgi:phosphatidylglycerol lysyltransferase
LSPAWIAAILVILGGSLCLGLFAYKHVEYAHDLWWEFSLEGNAPRFLRASVGALAIAVSIAINRLLRPAPGAPRLPSEEELQRAAALAAGAARSDAHLALVGDKELLWNEARTAFLMYGVQGKSWIAMGDPVGPEAERIELGWRFRELAERHVASTWPPRPARSSATRCASSKRSAAVSRSAPRATSPRCCRSSRRSPTSG